MADDDSQLDLTATPPPLDLTEPRFPDDSATRGRPLAINSEAWAALAKPFACFVFFLTLLGLLIPYAIFTWGINGLPASDRAGLLSEWSHAMWPPIVGFASAVVGYYFGNKAASG